MNFVSAIKQSSELRRFVQHCGERYATGWCGLSQAQGVYLFI